MNLELLLRTPEYKLMFLSAPFLKPWDTPHPSLFLIGSAEFPLPPIELLKTLSKFYEVDAEKLYDYFERAVIKDLMVSLKAEFEA